LTGCRCSSLVLVLCTASSGTRIVGVEDLTENAAKDTPVLSADAVDIAVQKTHEAEKQQRYSLKDPVFGDLPRSVTEGINFSNSQCDNFFYEYVRDGMARKKLLMLSWPNLSQDGGPWIRLSADSTTCTRRVWTSIVLRCFSTFVCVRAGVDDVCERMCVLVRVCMCAYVCSCI